MKWRAFPLHPETPEEGKSLEELFKGTPINIDKMMEKLKKTAAQLNLEFGDRKMTYNSRLAQELGLWAETKEKGDAFHMAAFTSYFVKGENIAKKDVLLNLVETAGLDKQEGEDVLENRTFKSAVDSDWELSRHKQVTAVPTFFLGLDRLVGAQPYEVLERLVKKYSVQPL